MSFPRLKLPQRRKGTGQFLRLAADYNALLDCLRELESRTQHLFPQPSPTVQPKMSPSGTTWTAAASTAQRAARHPFQLLVGADDEGNGVVRVVPGTVDGSMAEMSALPLTNDPAPEMTPPSAGEHVVYLDMDFAPNVFDDFQDPPEQYLGNGGAVTAARVFQVPVADWPPEGETDPTTTANGVYYQRIGRYKAETIGGKLMVTFVENDTVTTSLQSVFCPPGGFNLLRI